MAETWSINLKLELDSPIPIYQQIEQSIANDIAIGRLIPGAPLPGSRQIAGEYRISRSTVVKAFDNLIARGLLSVDNKRGTFVSDLLPEVTTNFNIELPSKAAYEFAQLDYTPVATMPVDGFWQIRVDDGFPDPQIAPLLELVMTYRRVFNRAIKRQKVEYDVPEAYIPLQQRFNLVLNQQRGFNLKAENVAFCYGQHMVLYMIARILVQPGDVVVLPELSSPSAHHIFTNAGATIRHVGQDENGLKTDELERICNSEKVKAVYVMSQCHFPTATTLSDERGAELVELASCHHFAIIETDYDHEYWFSPEKYKPLAAQYGTDHIIYISSLSKMLPPFYLLGVVAAAPDFIQSLKALRGMIGQQGDVVLEHAAEELLHEGALNRYTRKATQLYKDKRDAVAMILSNYLQGKIKINVPKGGLAFWIEFILPTDVDYLLQQLLRRGIYLRNPRDYTADGKQVNGLRLGFGVLEITQLEKVVRAIAEVLNR